MKKFLVTVLMLSLVFSVASADVDISGMSIDELIVLRNEIDTLIMSKLGAGIPAKGRFITGEDIKEGYYLLTCDQNGETGYTTISVYYTLEDAENKVEGEKKKQDIAIAKAGSTVIHLQKGNVLEIENDSVILTAIPDPDWKP